MKVFSRKSAVAFLLITMMLCTMFPAAVFAANTPALLYGLKANAVVDPSEITFGVSGITEAPVVSVGGVAIDASNVTYSNGVVKVDASSNDIVFGSNNMTVTASQADGGASIFSGNVVLESFGAPVDASGVMSNHTKKNGATYATSTTDNNYWTYTVPASGSIWTYAPGNSNFTDYRKYGVYNIELEVKTTNAAWLILQVFPNKNASQLDTSAVQPKLLENGYFGGLTSNPALAASSTETKYTFHCQIDSYAKEFRLWVTPDGGEKMFVGTTALNDKFYNYGFNHARFYVGNKSGSQITVDVRREAEFTYTNPAPIEIASVTASGRDVAVNDNGAYEVTPGDTNVTIVLNKNITGTVSLGTATATVTDSNAIVFNDLELSAGSHDLVIPADVTTVGVAKLGNKKIFSSLVEVTNEYAIISPLEGAAYNKNDDIFIIFDGEKSVQYVLNGVECADIAALNANLKNGKNVLEVYAKDSSGTTAERINFYVSDTQIYNPQNFSYSGKVYDSGRLTINGGSNSTATENGVTYTVTKPSSTTSQLNLPQNMTVLRDMNSGTNFDNRFFSGIAVYEMDVRFPNASVSTWKFGFRNSTLTTVFTNGACTLDGIPTTLQSNVWYNFKLKMDFVNKKTEFFIDDKLAYSNTPTTAYLTPENNALLMMAYVTVNDANKAPAHLNNVKFYFEVPASIEGITYGEGKTATTTGVVPVTTTSFGVTTSLRIPDSEITSENIQLLVDGNNVATAVTKDSSDSNYLGAGVEQNNGTKTSYYTENGEKVYKQLWMGGTKGTKLNLTIPRQIIGTNGTIVIKAGTKVVATDWKFTTNDANASNVQKLITLEKDLVYPVYFAGDGVYAELKKAGNELRTIIITDGTQEEICPVQIISEYSAGKCDVNFRPYPIEAGVVRTIIESNPIDVSAATTAKGMVWMLDSLRPLTDYVTLK